MQCKEIVAMASQTSQTHTTHINTLCGQNVFLPLNLVIGVVITKL
jgi:hypothetical protein